MGFLQELKNHAKNAKPKGDDNDGQAEPGFRSQMKDAIENARPRKNRQDREVDPAAADEAGRKPSGAIRDAAFGAAAGMLIGKPVAGAIVGGLAGRRKRQADAASDEQDIPLAPPPGF